jgi:hypothetical protein
MKRVGGVRVRSAAARRRRPQRCTSEGHSSPRRRLAQRDAGRAHQVRSCGLMTGPAPSALQGLRDGRPRVVRARWRDEWRATRAHEPTLPCALHSRATLRAAKGRVAPGRAGPSPRRPEPTRSAVAGGLWRAASEQPPTRFIPCLGGTASRDSCIRTWTFEWSLHRSAPRTTRRPPMLRFRLT